MGCITSTEAPANEQNNVVNKHLQVVETGIYIDGRTKYSEWHKKVSNDVLPKRNYGSNRNATDNSNLYISYVEPTDIKNRGVNKPNAIIDKKNYADISIM